MCLQAADTGDAPPEGDEQSDDSMCVVCWESVRKVISIHCGHMVRSLTRSAHKPPKHFFDTPSTVTVC